MAHYFHLDVYKTILNRIGSTLTKDETSLLFYPYVSLEVRSQIFALTDDINALKLLYQYGVNNMNEVFMNAALTGQTKVIASLLEIPSFYPEHHLTLLNESFRMAVKGGHFDIITLLPKSIIKFTDHNDWAFRFASDNGYLNIVQFLLKQKADLHACQDDAFISASCNSHLETVKFLFEQKADLHAQKDMAFRYAAVFGKIETVKFLLEQKADLHADRSLKRSDPIGLKTMHLNMLLIMVNLR